MLVRGITAEFNGNEMYLAYTVNAMFQINDMMQEDEELLAVFDGKGAEGLERFCKGIEILAQCGAKVRESDGLKKSYVPAVDEMIIKMTPVEYMKIKQAAVNAIMLGYGREVTNPDEEIDLELSKLEKKQNPPEPES
jgi:hypothetical protein